MDASESATIWAQRLAAITPPMLRRTRNAIAKAWQQPERVDANMLTGIVLRDPLMTLRILAHVNVSRPSRVVTAPETVCASILVIGLNAFRRLVDDTPLLEDLLTGEREVRQRFAALFRRARRAGRIGLALASECQDPDATLVYEAALIHDVCEMLIWIVDRQTGRRLAQARRSGTADPAIGQRAVLGCSLIEIAVPLMRIWQLPSALTSATGAGHADSRTSRIARIAIRFAEHVEHGWSHPAILDDLKELASLTNLSLPAARALLDRAGAY